MTGPADDRPPQAERAGTTVKDGNLATSMHLKDFMSQLGVVMKLPDKEKPKPVKQIAATATPGTKPLTRLWLPVLAVLGAAGFAGARLRPPPVFTLPAELTGTWVTPHPEFAGRRMIFTPTSLLQVNDTTADPVPWKVLHVATRRYADTIQVQLVHEADGGTMRLEMAYTRGAFESINLKNPAAVAWYRIADSAAYIPGFRAAAPASGVKILNGKKPWEH
jgi:hypothetical protein